MNIAAWDPELVALTAAGEPVGALFMALVDRVDPSAVTSLLAIIPNQDGSGLRAFERKNGGWTEAPNYIRDINGLSPPPLVELDVPTLKAVVEQIDSWDAKNQNQEG